MQESPNGMAPASQAGSRGFDSRLLLHKKGGFPLLFFCLFLPFCTLLPLSFLFCLSMPFICLYSAFSFLYCFFVGCAVSRN